MVWQAQLDEIQERIEEQSPDGTGSTQNGNDSTQSVSDFEVPVYNPQREEPELDRSLMENGSEEPIETNTLGNTTAGFVNGILNDSFSASAGEYIEARMPMGRLFATNKQGETKFWMSTPEWLGISEEEWDNMEVDQRSVAISDKTRKHISDYYEADPESTAFIIASIGGSLVDPSTRIPIFGKTRTARAMSGAGVGMLDAAAYMKTTEGEIDPLVLGAAGVLGGGLAALLKAPARESDQIIETFNEVYKLNQAGTASVADAYNATLRQLGHTDASMALLAKDAVRAKVGKPLTQVQAQEAIKASSTVNKSTIMPKAARYVFEPISESLKRNSPVMHKMVQNQMRAAMELGHVTMTRVDPFYRRVDKLKSKNYEAWKAIDKAMFEGSDDLPSLVATHMGEAGTKDLALLRKTYDELFERAKATRGEKFKYKANYFPRYVKNLDALKEEVAKLKGKDGVKATDAMEKILAEKKAKLGRSLSIEEEAALYEKFLTSNPSFAHKIVTPGSTKARVITELPEEVRQKIYATPAEAAHSSIRQMAINTTRREMFGKKIVGATDDDLTAGINEFIAQHKAGKTDIEEVRNLLNLLYIDGTKKPKEFVQWFKNIGYMATLGNPISAVTQFCDIILSAYKIGAMNTLDGVVKGVTGKGLKPQDFGFMDNMLEELASTSKSKKALDFTLRWSGFSSVDRLGKATLMNGSLRRMQNMSRNAKGIKALRGKWSEAFGDDWPKVEQALRKGDITDDVKTMVFMELADVQPITLLEMPKAYLANPNGRTLYMLHTFTTKFLNLVRRDMIDELARGNVRKGLIAGTALMSAYIMGNASTQLIKNEILRRDTNLDAIPADSLMQLASMNRYQIEQMSKSKTPATDVVTSFAPPMPWLDSGFRALMEAGRTGEISKQTTGDMVRAIPLIGPMWYNFGFGGLEKANSRQ